ncbi:MAG TPA: hypothetical protein VJ596_06400, partial [Gemmatimonadaceae bacterium]|nr:hypothetical protein [Gemmatimonadaceae bacterium]
AVRPVASTIVGLEAISRDTVVEDGRMVETSVYELRPGVSVTLRVATAIGDRRDADLSQRAAARPAPPPAASLQRGARASQPAVRSMRWVTPTGAEVTLSGAVAEEELGRVRERVAVP